MKVKNYLSLSLLVCFFFTACGKKKKVVIYTTEEQSARESTKEGIETAVHTAHVMYDKSKKVVQDGAHSVKVACKESAEKAKLAAEHVRAEYEKTRRIAAQEEVASLRKKLAHAHNENNNLKDQVKAAQAVTAKPVHVVAYTE